MDERLKSERLKAELITNVSHDLKTPLTSIINYVDLLKKTGVEDPKALEYIEVLDRKSQRLKKLTEDLVEASKASTGALTVNKERLGFIQLLDQALGEYEEKFEKSGLSPCARPRTTSSMWRPTGATCGGSSTICWATASNTPCRAPASIWM
ncbi:MAG: sensor histidine kinase [Intestinimonas sp.]